MARVGPFEAQETTPHACPHCAELRVSECCACDGTGLVKWTVVEKWATNAWDVPGCGCQACRVLRGRRIKLDSTPGMRVQTARRTTVCDSPESAISLRF